MVYAKDCLVWFFFYTLIYFRHFCLHFYFLYLYDSRIFIKKFSLQIILSHKITYMWCISGAAPSSNRTWRCILIELSHCNNVTLFIMKISFPLYPAYSRVDKGHVVLRHSILHFPSNFGGIACWMAELNAALYLDTRAKKW